MHDTIEKYFSENIGDDSWLIEFKQLLANNSEGIFHSYMHLDFDKWIDIETRREVFMQICEETKQYLQKEIKTVSESELKKWFEEGKIGYVWNSSIEGERLIKVIEYLENLIDDKILITVSDKIDYSF